jgi:succinylarginine dihydrolase
MGRHMKTTVEISDPLLAKAREVAKRDGTTVRALIELGLREVLAARRRPPAFRLRKASFKGRGLQSEARGLGWERLREAAYEGRGA